MKRSYAFDIVVESADKLEGVGDHINKFMRELGEGEAGINVIIGNTSPDYVVDTHAIGFAVSSEEDDEMEDD